MRKILLQLTIGFNPGREAVIRYYRSSVFRERSMKAVEAL